VKDRVFEDGVKQLYYVAWGTYRKKNTLRPLGCPFDANPLEDISNTRKISGVFTNGHWIDKENINRILSDLAKRNIANKKKYDWGKRKEF
jgi:hypothetical protein